MERRGSALSSRPLKESASVLRSFGAQAVPAGELCLEGIRLQFLSGKAPSYFGVRQAK